MPDDQPRGPDHRPTPAVPAASVLLVRDGPDGLEVLLLRRSPRVSFAPGAWVFPGGRVDDEDFRPGDDGELAPARRAAVREVAEEAGLVVDAERLVPTARWLPPPSAPRRFSTWFFLAPADDAPVTVDGYEIDAHQGARPAAPLDRHRAGELDLMPPTWVSLWGLAAAPHVDAALAAAPRPPRFYETHLVALDDGAVALWAGDAGYEDHDADRPGPRHRLWMVADGWRFEATAATSAE